MNILSEVEMEAFANYLRMFPAGFWVALTILLVGILWIIFEVKEAPDGMDIEGQGFISFEQLWYELKKENAVLNSGIKLLEIANQKKYIEGYEAGLNEKLSAYLINSREKLQLAPVMPGEKNEFVQTETVSTFNLLEPVPVQSLNGGHNA
jgi:hypothetical protein